MSADGSAGDVLIESSAGQPFVIASSANRGSRRATGIAMTNYRRNGVVEIQQVGQVASSITGLGAGTASWVRVSSAGRLERCTPDADDDVVGRCDADGTLHCLFGCITAEMAIGRMVVTLGPTGSGANYVTDGTSDEVQFNAAITLVNAAGGGLVDTLAGTYTIGSQINGASNVTVRGRGAGVSVIRAATAFSSSTNKWTIGAAGTVGTSMNLGSDATFGATTITATAGSTYDAVAAGDFLFLISEALWETKNLSGRCRGEFVKVYAKASSADLKLYGCVRDSYATADTARLLRMTFVDNFCIEGFSITQQAAQGTRAANVPPAVSFQGCRNSGIKDCEVYALDGPAVTDYHSVATFVDNCYIHDLTSDSPNGRLGYGVLIGGASEDTTVTGNRFGPARHCIDAGPSSAHATLSSVSNYGVPRGVAVTGNSSVRSMNVPFSTHSESDGWSFSGNLADSSESVGFYIRGRNHSIAGNTVRYCSGGIQVGNSGAYNSQGGSGSGTHVVGNSISHCKSITSGTGAGTNFSGRGIILSTTDNAYVSGNSISACDGSGVYIRQYTNRSVIQNNTITNCNTLNTANISAVDLEVNPVGAAATLTYSAGVITATGLSALADPAVGQNIVISGAATSANNGTFVIVSVPSATSVTYANASGATDANNGSIAWYVECSTGNIIDGNTAVNSAASIYDRDCTGHMKYFARDGGGVGNVGNSYTNNTAKGMETAMFALTGVTQYMANNNDGSAIADGGSKYQFDTETIFENRTTDGTPTALLTVPSATGHTYVWRGFVHGGTGGGGHFYYSINGFFDNNAGTLTQRIAVPVTEERESSTSASLTLTASGTNMVLTWTGVAATTIRLHGRVFISDGKAT